MRYVIINAKTYWSDDVQTGDWKCPDGLFTKDADRIASILKRESNCLKQAMSRLIFYINRAGDNLSAKDKARLEHAKNILRGLYS